MSLRARVAKHLASHWRRWVLVLLSIMMFLIGTLILPFVVERQGTDSFDFDERDTSAEALETFNVYARYEQFNVDVNSYLRFTRYFPQSLYDDPLESVSYRYRPLYLAVSSIIPRVVALISKWPDWHSALTEPTALRLTFLSMLFTNFVLLLAGIQIFYSWMLRHFPTTVSFIAAIMLVLSPQWFIAANTVTTRIVGYVVLIVVPYLFDRWLLGDEEPGWKRILGVSLVAGTLFLGKTNYDAIMACWLWAIYLRRWRALFGTFFLFLIPLVVWVGILALMGLEYYNHDVVVYRQGVWMLDALRDGKLWSIYPRATSQASSFLGGVIGAFSIPILLLAVWALAAEEQPLSTERKRLYLLAFIAVMGFAVIVGHPAGGGKFSFDVFFVIYPLAAVGLVALVQRLSEWALARNQKATWVFHAALAAFFLVNTAIAWRYLTIRGSFVWNPAFDEFPSLLGRLKQLLALTGPEY
jgi:hypothetical protein